MNKCSMDNYIYHPKNIEILLCSRGKIKHAELHQICLKLSLLSILHADREVFCFHFLMFMFKFINIVLRFIVS